MRETSKKMTATDLARPFAKFAFEATVDADDDRQCVYVSDGKIVRADLVGEIVSALQPHVAKIAFACNVSVAEYEQEIFDDLTDNLSEGTLLALALAAKARRS
jgi:hypothetical protein